MSAPVIVYYNSACPVCRSGIELQKRDLAAAEVLENATFIDMTCSPDALAADGLTLDHVRRHLYVRDADGRLHRGMAAFAALWRVTPGREWMARIVSAPVIRSVARFSYDRFADLLYTWNRSHRRW